MSKRFINFSNHPSQKWSQAQRDAALTLGPAGILDLPFPNIDPSATTEECVKVAENTISQIEGMGDDGYTLMAAGEATVIWHTIRMAKQANIVCVTACTHRVVKETQTAEGKTEKTAVFEFLRFREI